jgi:RND family efflux transporter MFP subunit
MTDLSRHPVFAFVPSLPGRKRAGRALAALAALAFVAGCGRGTDTPPTAGRPVRVVTVESTKLRNALTLTGEIQAQADVNIAFRIAGRMVASTLKVGDVVKAGQVIATLDPATEQNALRAANAAAVAARGEVVNARSTFDRQERLLDQGFTTRPRFDQAKQALETAQARLEDAEARVETSQNRLGFTQLRADAAGVVTARGAEPGEVVQPGQMIVRLARDDGRDAVFDVPASIPIAQSASSEIRVSLSADAVIAAVGRIREISPQADPVTRTFRVRVGLDNPPAAMRLGSTVNGAVDLSSSVVVAVPASALTSSAGRPAVWILDQAKSTVSLRPIDVLRFEPGRVVISQGLEPGDVVVTAGIQALHPGQRVSPLPPPAPVRVAVLRARATYRPG